MPVLRLEAKEAREVKSWAVRALVRAALESAGSAGDEADAKARRRR